MTVFSGQAGNINFKVLNEFFHFRLPIFWISKEFHSQEWFHETTTLVSRIIKLETKKTFQISEVESSGSWFLQSSSHDCSKHASEDQRDLQHQVNMNYQYYFRLCYVLSINDVTPRMPEESDQGFSDNVILYMASIIKWVTKEREMVKNFKQVWRHFQSLNLILLL